MAYKRPLSTSQSVCITILWCLFLAFYWKYGEHSVFSWFIVLASAFIVFYPIRKSYLQRKDQEKLHRGIKQVEKKKKSRK